MLNNWPSWDKALTSELHKIVKIANNNYSPLNFDENVILNASTDEE